jgi:Cu2+-exporting ATPase
LVAAAAAHADEAAARSADGPLGSLLPQLAQFEEHAGHGVQAVDERGRRWRLGSRRWAAAAPELPGPDDEAAQAGDAAYPAGVPPDDENLRVWLCLEGSVLAGFAVEESIREGAAEAVAELRRQGVQVTLLSGDRDARARSLAARLSIDDVVAEATPADKLAVLSAAQARGLRVAMVGDGINDAPVLARADVAVAMGQGALLARSQADAVLAAGRPLDLVEARRVAQRAVRIVHQNLLWAAAYNALAVPLALAGWLPPWAAGLGMALSSLWVVLNATRAGR